MKKDNRHQIFFLCAAFLTASIFFVFLAGKAQAANCGGATVCNCGDTVTASTTLTGNLTCTGHGLVVGANSITVDGGNYTLTGDFDIDDYGINNAGGYDSITVKNINITNFNEGIYFNYTTGSTIQNVTANSNTLYGIYILQSSSNTLTGNTVNSNSLWGIYLNGSSSNTLTNNSMSGNVGGNLYIYNLSSGDGGLNNTIDTTNKVEGKSVYYFYNNDGTAQNPLVYDGDVLGDDIGMFWCIHCDYVQIKNAALSINNHTGIYFFDTTNSTIQNVTANSNSLYGIHLYSSSSNTLTGNTTNFNINGIAVSDPNTLTNNTANSNSNIGISIGGPSSTLTNNVVLNNRQDINVPVDEWGEYYDNTFSSNQFNHNMSNAMLTFTETARTKNVNDSVSFDVSMFNPNGSACSDCSYTVTASPSETISSSQSGNQVTGNFTVTKSGTYSLIFTITDSNSNITKRNYLFFVGDTNSQTTKYYLRGITPTHGQPKGNDGKSLLLTAPTSSEVWSCTYWIQNSPDEIPNYPLANLSGINTYSWYKFPQNLIMDTQYIGVERFVNYTAGSDYNSSVSTVTNYTWINKNFTNLNWAMDYFRSWYWISLKLFGSQQSYWITSPVGETDKSYADFTYQFAATPTVKSISNENVIILSATADPNATSSVSIVLENPLTAATSTNLVLTDFKRPFLGATSTIDSTATTTITTPSISANATSTFNSVPMDLTPSSGSIDVAIDTWNTTSTYYKKWTEVGDTPAATAAHTVGDLRANQWYQVKVGSSVINTLQANSSGEIIFTYSGGYSTKTFEVEELPTAPTIGIPAAVSSSSIRWNFTDNADNETGFRLYDNTDTLVASSATANLSYLDETGLSENTQYSGRYVRAYNGNGNSSASSTASAYTLADTPTNLTGVSGSNSMTLSVDSFPNASSDSSGYYFANTTNSTNSGWIQTNSWENTGLSCGTSYNYTVKYRNGGGTETSTITLTQTTSACADGDDLEISNIEYSSTSNSIIIEWETNNKSDSRVRYGKDRNLDQEKREDNRTKNHKVTLKNLDSDTLYYFRVKSVDGNGSEDSSDIKSIRTKKKTGAFNFANDFLNSASGGDEPEKEKQEAGSEKDVIEKINEIPEKIQKWSEGLYETNVFTFNGKKILQEIRFQFTDKNNGPIPNLEVTLHSETKKSVTDDEGYAAFNEVETGRHTLTFNYHNQNRKFAVNIPDPETKSGEVKIETVVIKVNEIYFDWRLIAAVAALIVFILTIFWLKKRKQS